MDRYVPFRAPSDLFLSLRMAAEQRGVSVSSVIRDLLARGIAEDARNPKPQKDLGQ